MKFLIHRLLCLSIILFSVAVFPAQKPSYYNEVYNDNGSVREQYKALIKKLSGMSDKEVEKFITTSKGKMSNDTPISPLARIFTLSEFVQLKTGTEQRAKAIQAFLMDHYSGEQKYRDTVIPGEIIDSIIARTGEGNYLDAYKKVNPKDLKFRFLYGPDIIRDKNGKWLVLEDNLGFVGGTPGDTIPARQTWEGLMPDLVANLPIQNRPENFLTDLMDEMHKLAKPKLGFHENEGVMVMLSSPPYGDNEDVRMAEEFNRRGIILVTPNTAKKRKNGASKRLEVGKDGAVYLHETTKYGGTLQPRKVGMLWLNAEHAWVDWQNPVVREKALIEEARDYLDEKSTKKKTKTLINAALELDPKTGRINLGKLEDAIRWAHKNDFAWTPSALTHRSPVPGLLNAILEGKVESNYMPGTEFVGDKMVHSYIPELIRFYLGEEPILENPKTNRFFKQDKNGKLVLDKEAIDRAMRNRESSVIKVVDGRGGDGIYIGPKLSPKEWKALGPTLQQEFLRYLDQEYHHPSVMEIKNKKGESRKYIADTRMFSWVGENGVIVSGTPWGRSTLFEHNGKPTKDDGKVNMSTGNGTLTLMLVVPDPKGCAKKLAKLANPKN